MTVLETLLNDERSEGELGGTYARICLGAMDEDFSEIESMPVEEARLYLAIFARSAVRVLLDASDDNPAPVREWLSSVALLMPLDADGEA